MAFSVLKRSRAFMSISTPHPRQTQQHRSCLNCYCECGSGLLQLMAVSKHTSPAQPQPMISQVQFPPGSAAAMRRERREWQLCCRAAMRPLAAAVRRASDEK